MQIHTGMEHMLNIGIAQFSEKKQPQLHITTTAAQHDIVQC